MICDCRADCAQEGNSSGIHEWGAGKYIQYDSGSIDVLRQNADGILEDI